MASKATRPETNPAPAPEGHERFNLATMSGVFPGTRTQVYQRLQIEQGHERFWLQLQWHEEPPRIVAYRLDRATTEPNPTPFLEVVLEATSPVSHQLQEALGAKGCALRSCGSCAFWQPFTDIVSDQLPIGHCRWIETTSSRAATVAQREATILYIQSFTAAACRHWEAGDAAQATTTADSRVIPPQRAMRRAAEDAEIRQPILSRWWRWAQRWLKTQRRSPVGRLESALAHRQIQLVERSGVGAGTELCLVCQGRIANLGALTVATEEDDKQTFSIWRCRTCHTLYLNNWVDRWERLDNLETEESYYRIAPDEASALLTLMHAYQGGEHPNRRYERAEARAALLNFMQDRIPLSHQIRQGR